MHFYDREANSVHEILGKNGKMRATTIKDAREHGYVPSVSTVMSLGCEYFTPDDELIGSVNPLGFGIVNWMHGILLDTVIKIPFHPEEWDESSWKDKVYQQFNIDRSKAAKRGTEIHDKLEQYFVTGKVDDVDKEYVMPVVEFLNKEFHGVQWISEKSFAHPVGFGGRVDLHSVTDNIVIDFKTKDKTDPKDMIQYDDHRIQLSSYQEGFGLPKDSKRYNLFVSVHKDTPGLCKLAEAVDHDRYFAIFNTMLDLWKLRNKYDSSWSK